MSSLVFEAITLWMLGYPEQAEADALAALAFARELGYPFSLSWCLEELIVYYSIRGDLDKAALLIEEGVPLSREHGYTHLEEGMKACQLLALAAQGRLEEMIARSRQARKFSEIEYEIRQTWVRSTLAEAFGKADKIPLALSLLKDATEIMERNDERYIEPELHRIRGEISFQQYVKSSSATAQLREAEQSFLQAIEIARRRDAKMLELRAAIGLGRMLSQTGRAADSAQILTKTCSFFTEGFDTPEFKMAQALLRSLPPVNGSISNT